MPYLTDAAIFATLRYVAGIPAGETVFDYGNPLEQLDPAMQADVAARAKRAAEIGEPFLSHFDTGELHRRLRDIGATEIDDFGPERLAALYGRTALSDAGGHIVDVRFGDQS